MNFLEILELYLIMCIPLAVMAFAGWLLSLKLGKVSIVDSMWSIYIAVAGVGFVWHTQVLSNCYVFIACLLLVLWAVRLSGHLTFRNWGKGEDHRYETIGKNFKPFKYKSLYVVFGLQAFLASLVALPFLGMAMAEGEVVSWVFYLAAALSLFGIIFEAVADYQLYHFLKHRDNTNQVMDKGLWRYTRHPNYFGEFCVWWGLFGVALSMGAFWTIISPLLMTILLFKVSGVGMMEKTITENRPKYKEYIRKTNAFFPGIPKE